MSDTAPDKWVCDYFRCRWSGITSELLVAPDPFNDGQQLYACPKCRCDDHLRRACDMEGCVEPSTCGFPVNDARRYLWTCYDHSEFKRGRS